MVTATGGMDSEEQEYQSQERSEQDEANQAEPNAENTQTEENTEPEQPQLSLREQFAKDMEEAKTSVATALTEVQRLDTTPEQRDEAIQTYMEARKTEAALQTQEAELETKEKRITACVQINKMTARVLKTLGIEDFEYHYTPIAEDGTGGAAPAEAKQRRSSSNTGGTSGEGTNPRSTVTFIVDGVTFNPPALMKQFGDEKLDNPNGSNAWANNKTHPKFYSSVYVRLLKMGKTVEISLGDYPAKSHTEFDGWVDHHKARLGWDATGEKKSSA